MEDGVFRKIQRIPLYDFLDDLSIDRAKGNDSIRIYSIKRFLFPRLKRGQLKEISNRTKIKYKDIRNWLGDSRVDIGIPIGCLIKIGKSYKIRRAVIFKGSRYFGCTNSKRVRLPKHLCGELSYLAGFIMGDGHLANPDDLIGNGSAYNAEIRITTCERSHLVFLQSIFKKLFRYSPPLFQEKEFFRLVGRSKAIHRFLSTVCGIPTGNKSNSTYIPAIFKRSVAMQRMFLSGFFDADGSVTVRNGRISGIRIKQHNRKILEQCVSILKDDGIFGMGLYQDNWERNGKLTVASVLVIQNRKDVTRFINTFFSLKIQETEVRLMEERKTPKHIAIIPDGK